MAKKLTTLYLDIEMVKRLNKLSALTRIPKAVLIREGIDLTLDKHEKLLKGKPKKREG